MTLIRVNSSAIEAVGYDGHVLRVVFTSGRTYDHPGVTYDVYEGLMNASSMGAFYSRHIRGRYR